VTESIHNFFHILNPNQKNRKAVEKFFKASPTLEAVWVERTSHPTHVETIVEWALLNKRPRLAVWGGDGTMNRVLQSLFDFQALGKIELAFVPAGTGNDFARNLGLKARRDDWIRLFKSGAPCKFDLGVMTAGPHNRVFLNNAGFGRPPSLARKRSRPIQDLLAFTPKTIQIEWGLSGRREYVTTDSFFSIVFNAPFFNKGLFFDRAIDPADGLLDAMVVRPQSKMALLMRLLNGRLGRALASDTDLRLRAEFLNIESTGNLFPQVDGDPAFRSEIRQLNFSILKKAVNLRAFPTSHGANS
jgi:diacylglycerol kinase family enzyme